MQKVEKQKDLLRIVMGFLLKTHIATAAFLHHLLEDVFFSMDIFPPLLKIRWLQLCAIASSPLVYSILLCIYFCVELRCDFRCDSIM